MKKTLFLLLCMFTLLSFSSNAQKVYKPGETQAILKAAAAKLNSLQSVSYKYKRETLYAGENYHNVYNTTVYFDLKDGGGFHYQSEDEKYFSCYNGSQYFFLNKADKTIDIKNKPGNDIFESLSPLYNSLITLRNIFPVLVKNDSIEKTLTDTVINNEGFYQLKFELYDHYLGNLGTMEKFTKAYIGDKRKPYEILFSKKSLLPCRFTSKFNDRKKDFISAGFLEMNINPKRPDELSWFYSTYTDEYKAPKPPKPLIAVGTEPADWKLPAYDSKKTDSVSLYQYRGKIVMLDFWIKTCGPCLASFPYLDELQQKFGTDKFQLLSINTQDNKDDIAFFNKKHKPVYKMLFNAERLVEEYGIPAYPTVIILGRSGKIMYAGNLDKDEIEKILVKNL